MNWLRYPRLFGVAASGHYTAVLATHHSTLRPITNHEAELQQAQSIGLLTGGQRTIPWLAGGMAAAPLGDP
jgi:hypothetical protein